MQLLFQVMTTLFVEQLTVIDFSFFDHHRGIVGESWILDVELEGTLDENGMVFDFSHVKKQIKHHVDQLIDHKLLIPKQLPGLKTDIDGDQLTCTATTHGAGYYRHSSPVQAVTFIPADAVTIETVKPYLQQSLMSILPKNVAALRIELREEVINDAYYHYSHGLKRHFGDCQRIAHGHRSRIQVFINNNRAPNLEQKIAKEWEDIYLISEEDLIASKDEHNFLVAYSANQGYFELSIPKHQCDIIPTDSTVELIAEYLATKLKNEHPNDQIKVRAFEGVQKGAIASA